MTTFNVYLLDYGTQPHRVMAAIRSYPRAQTITLPERPTLLVRSVSEEVAKDFAEWLRTAGAEVEVKPRPTPRYDLYITAVEDITPELIKVVNQVQGTQPKQTKQLLKNLPALILENLSIFGAVSPRRKLEVAGATVELHERMVD